jgi:hypothetical protein
MLAFAIPAVAVEPLSEFDGYMDGRKKRYPSPDERYCFLITYATGDEKTDRVELIEKATERTLAVFSDPKDLEANSSNAGLLWSADSKRVALWWGKRRTGSTRLFTRSNDTFQEVKLPKLPIPPDTPSDATMKKYHWEFVRFVTLDDVWPERWTKSGDLELSISTEASGTTGVLGWIYTVVLAIDDKHRAKIQSVKKRETFSQSH